MLGDNLKQTMNLDWSTQIIPYFLSFNNHTERVVRGGVTYQWWMRGRTPSEAEVHNVRGGLIFWWPVAVWLPVQLLVFLGTVGGEDI